MTADGNKTWFLVENIEEVGHILNEAVTGFDIPCVILNLPPAECSRLIMIAEDLSLPTWSMNIEEYGGRAGLFLSASGREEIVRFEAAPLRYAPVATNWALDSKRVLILHSTGPDAWAEAALAYALESAKQAGLYAEVFAVPKEGLHSKTLFAAVVSSSAGRMVFIDLDPALRGLLQHSERYRHVACLTLTPGFVFPQAVKKHTGYASVMRSIDDFMHGCTLLAESPASNSGWDKLWAELTS